MKNILLLSFDGKSRITYDEKPEFKTIVNTWDVNVTKYPHECLGVFYSPTQRHGEAMYIQGKILKDLWIDYDYVASFCHDLEIKVSEINRYFRIAHENKLDCFGPSTSLDSYFSHKEFVHTGTKDVLPREWIEIMAIGFSKRLYEKLFYHLEILYGKINLVGGWGLDNILIKDLVSKNQYKCALIDEIQVRHTKKVTRGEIVWRNGLTSRDCMAFYETYVRYIGTRRFQKYVSRRALESKGTKPYYDKAGECNLNKYNQILYVRLTCKKEERMWPSYRRPNVNQILLCGVPDLDTNYKLVDDVLYLKCEDTYEFLPTKMVMAYNVILTDKRFENYSHIFKLDNDINIDQVWEFVNQNSDLIGSEDYTGGNVYYCQYEPGATWHFGSVPETSYWHNRPFFEKRVLFASGGHTYTLSRDALKVICNEFNFDNIDEVCKKYILEDMMVALILERNGITPVEHSLEVKNTSFRKRNELIKKTQNPSTRGGVSLEDTSKVIKRGSKNLVVQIFFDNELITDRPKTHTNHNRGPLISSKMIEHNIFKDSQKRAKIYAARCNADYVLFDKPVINYFSASMERMRLIEEEKWSKEYDNILYLDCDVIISNECPNLFELYPQKNLRACHSLMSNEWLLKKETTMVNEFGEDKILNQYFNGGVLLFHKSTLEAMRGKLDYRGRFRTYAFDDQSELNWVVMENDIPITMMGREYNSKPSPTAMMTHYLGNQKKQYRRAYSEPRKDRPTRRRFGKGPILVLRHSTLDQKHLWKEVKKTKLCDELIVCCDKSVKTKYQMVDGVLHINTDYNDEAFEYKLLKYVTSIVEFKKYTHLGVIDINKNSDKYFGGIKFDKLKKVHAVGEGLVFESNSVEPYIVSRKSISYFLPDQPDKRSWQANLLLKGIEVFNFDYIKS